MQAALAARGLTWPVIIVTAHGDAASARAALKAGAFDFVEKPFDDSLLLSALDRRPPRPRPRRRPRRGRPTSIAGWPV